MKLKKLIITLFLITRRFRVCTDTIHPNYCPPRFLENQWFGTKFHSRTDESRFCRLLRF